MIFFRLFILKLSIIHNKIKNIVKNINDSELVSILNLKKLPSNSTKKIWKFTLLIISLYKVNTLIKFSVVLIITYLIYSFFIFFVYKK